MVALKKSETPNENTFVKRPVSVTLQTCVTLSKHSCKTDRDLTNFLDEAI